MADRLRYHWKWHVSSPCCHPCLIHLRLALPSHPTCLDFILKLRMGPWEVLICDLLPNYSYLFNNSSLITKSCCFKPIWLFFFSVEHLNYYIYSYIIICFVFNVFERSLLCSPMLHLFDPKPSKTVKYCCYIIFIYIYIYIYILKCNLFHWWISWIFSSHYSSLQCHMILQK